MPVIGADLNVYSCPDKAYDRDTGQLGSLKTRRFREFWFENKATFFQIDPARDCNHHCEANEKNLLVLEYLAAEDEHLYFV